MNLPETIERVGARLAGLPLHNKVLITLAFTVLFGELLFRRLAPRSAAYKKWTAFFQKVGVVWTAVILSIVYFVSVGMVGIVSRLLGKDLLDRRLGTGPTAWRSHEPNPLGPLAAARHQF